MKPKIYRISLLIYLLFPLISILIIVKPNASIFYFKSSVDHEHVEADRGFAFRYPMNSNFMVSSYNLSLLYENGLLLTRAESAGDVRNVPGRFVFHETDDENLILSFSPSDRSDPRSNQKDYVVYHHIVFFSRPMGFFYLFIWALGTLWLGVHWLKSPKKQQLIHAMGIRKVKLAANNFAYWKYLFVITTLAIYAFVFMEWLFFATKPSFMDILNWGEKFEIYLLTCFFLTIIAMVFLALPAGVDYLFSKQNSAPLLRIAGLVLPALILLFLALMVLDNFTYTIFKFGVVTTGGIWRGVYALLLLILFMEIFIQLYGIFDFRENPEIKQNFKTLSIIVAGLLFVSTVVVFLQPKFIRNITRIEENETRQAESRYPNIILLGSDGLNAQNMSVYGYERETTPRIRELARTSLIAENAFPNAGNSAGSVMSILTGKLPTQTRLSYPPDILQGIDAYQHLPGILKREGYKNIEIAVPHYVDSFTMNMQNGFDIVNGRSENKDNPFYLLNTIGYHDIAYFSSTLTGRIAERILHVFYVNKMHNPYQTVTQPNENQVVEDREKVDDLIDLLTSADEPVFVHVHLMGTHGPKFFPNQRVYSKGLEQNEPWMDDFYDDAILDFDTYVGEVVDVLKNTGEIDHTILIIYTDHAQKYAVNIRIPFLIYFPRGEHQGNIHTNVQNLDISPTILDYLDLPQPDWMGGDSLLSASREAHRLIFSTRIVEKVTENNGFWNLDVDRLAPPFYQFGFVYVLDCHRWHMIDLALLQWDSDKIAGHTSPCNDDELVSLSQIKREVIQHLNDEGFDTSSLP